MERVVLGGLGAPEDWREVAVEGERGPEPRNYPWEFGYCFGERFAGGGWLIELEVGEGGGVGHVWEGGVAVAEDGDEVEEVGRLARFQRDEVDTETHAVGVGGGGEGEDEASELGGRAPGPAHLEVAEIARAAEPELAVLGTQEGEACRARGEGGREGGVEGAAKGEEGALEEVASERVVALLGKDLGGLEKRRDVVGVVVEELYEAVWV